MNQQQHWQAALIDIVARERREMRQEIVAILGELQSCKNAGLDCGHCAAVEECIQRILTIDAL